MSPTTKEQLLITFENDEERILRRVWSALRSPGRKGQPEYIGQKLSFNRWLVRVAVERARQIEADLSHAAPAK